MGLELTVWLIISMILSFIIMLYGIPKMIQIADLKQLYDNVEENRKIHTGKVPNIGGLIIVAAFFISFSVHPLASELSGYEYLISATIVLLAIGLKDDIFVISPEKKFIGQFIISTILIFGAKLTVGNLTGLFGIYELPYGYSILVSYLVFLGLMNAMNIIDGIDGLAGSLTILASMLFCYWFYISGNYPMFVFCVILAACYLPFLFYNWSPSIVFMGDTGAMFSGLCLSFIAVQFIDASIALQNITLWQPAGIVVLLSILIVPLYDTTRVVVLRLFKLKSPFKADNNHIHHQLLIEGFSHQGATLILLASNIITIALTVYLAPVISVTWLFFAVISFSLLIFPTARVKRSFIKKISNFFLNRKG